MGRFGYFLTEEPATPEDKEAEFMYDDDERDDPNDCAECARSNGPWYTGRCEH